MQVFPEWLLFQSHRPDAVGWLAMNWMFDPDAPPAVTIADVAKYMRDTDAPQAARAALAAAAEEYQEYRASVPNNVVDFPMTRETPPG